MDMNCILNAIFTFYRIWLKSKYNYNRKCQTFEMPFFQKQQQTNEQILIVYVNIKGDAIKSIWTTDWP